MSKDSSQRKGKSRASNDLKRYADLKKKIIETPQNKILVVRGPERYRMQATEKALSELGYWATRFDASTKSFDDLFGSRWVELDGDVVRIEVLKGPIVSKLQDGGVIIIENFDKLSTQNQAILNALRAGATIELVEPGFESKWITPHPRFHIVVVANPSTTIKSDVGQHCEYFDL